MPLPREIKHTFVHIPHFDNFFVNAERSLNGKRSLIVAIKQTSLFNWIVRVQQWRLNNGRTVCRVRCRGVIKFAKFRFEKNGENETFNGGALFNVESVI